jgi:Sigma-70, region 4
VLALVWPRWHRVAEGGNPEAYIRRVLFSTYLAWWRRRWRFELPSAAVPEVADTSDLAGDSATRDAVRRALARLSRQQRAVVVLRYVEDLSHAETAQLLGCEMRPVLGGRRRVGGDHGREVDVEHLQQCGVLVGVDEPGQISVDPLGPLAQPSGSQRRDYLCFVNVHRASSIHSAGSTHVYALAHPTPPGAPHRRAPSALSSEIDLIGLV